MERVDFKAKKQVNTCYSTRFSSSRKSNSQSSVDIPSRNTYHKMSYRYSNRERFIIAAISLIALIFLSVVESATHRRRENIIDNNARIQDGQPKELSRRFLLDAPQNGQYFRDIFSEHLAPLKIEFGHVCENPKEWEQRFERRDLENNQHQGKVRWGNKNGEYGEHYWDLNHGDDISIVAFGPQDPLGIVVMGVSSCAKSTVALQLAETLDIPFEDGDAYHSVTNLAKMRAGVALTDEDRLGWLERLSRELSRRVADGTGVVLVCSALKLSYRNILRTPYGDDVKKIVDFIFIQGSYELLLKRCQARTNHFMTSLLLQSQFDTLETPTIDENIPCCLKKGRIIVVSAADTVDDVVSIPTAQLRY